MMLMNTDVLEPLVESNSKWQTSSFMLWRQKQPRLMAQIRGGMQSMQMFMCVCMCVCMLVLKCVCGGGGAVMLKYTGERREKRVLCLRIDLSVHSHFSASESLLGPSYSKAHLPLFAFFLIFNLLCLSLFHLLLLYIYDFLVHLLIVSPPIECELHEDRDGVVLTALHHHLSRGWYVVKPHHVLLEWVDNRWAFKET